MRVAAADRVAAGGAGVDVRRLPKVELHLHLDCCVRYPVAARLDPTLTEEGYRTRFVAPAKCRDFAEWVERVEPALDLMQTEAGLRLVTRDVFRQLREDNVVYAEVRFAPLLHTRAGLSPAAVVGIVEGEAADAVGETGVEARLILCTLRHFAPEQSLETVDLVERFRGTLVAGLDIAGDEIAYPLAPHVPAFRRAASRGIPYTAHAGEGAGAGSVRETLDRLAPTRIGHGVRGVEDPALVERLARDGVHLEVCPSSNVQIDVVATYADHPIDRLARAGVSVGVSTDARAIVDVTLGEEYAALERTFGWGAEAFRLCNEAALAVAFVPEDVRRRLMARLGVGSADSEAG